MIIVQKSYCFSYCTQGPLWKHIRGTGLVYGFSLNLKPNESMIYLTIEETLSPAKAYKEITGHGELLELRLLEKSARHDFIIARHHSSNNIFSCHLLESS